MALVRAWRRIQEEASRKEAAARETVPRPLPTYRHPPEPRVHATILAESLALLPPFRGLGDGRGGRVVSDLSGPLPRHASVRSESDQRRCVSAAQAQGLQQQLTEAEAALEQRAEELAALQAQVTRVCPVPSSHLSASVARAAGCCCAA